ncbi:MAG: hypothetical protein HQL93_07775 [Magnetococcales bacterium]|nr:hypothetical protein [Magnetococcales bacterium]
MSEPIQVNNKGNYKLLSECLFKKLAADNQQMDLSLYTCSGRAELARVDEVASAIKIRSTSEGSLVQASTENINRIAAYLEICELEAVNH